MSDDNVDGPGSETYTLLNGLNIDEDDVLGTYRAYITNGGEGTSWTLTARLAGELEWAVSSFIPSHTGLNDDEPTFYSVTVVEYSEGTCAIDLYGMKTFSNTLRRQTTPITSRRQGDELCHLALSGSILIFSHALCTQRPLPPKILLLF